jgi:tetratricopeptide (TPR) repeat protein
MQSQGFEDKRFTIRKVLLPRSIRITLIIIAALGLGRLVVLGQNPAPAQESKHENNQETKQETKQKIGRLAQEANADLHHQKPDLAAAAYRKILLLDPENIEAHSNLGLAYYIQRDFTRAGEQFEIVLRARPDLWETTALCGLSEIQTGQRESAKAHLQAAFDHVQDTKLRLAVGTKLFSLAFESGNLKQASDIVDKLQQLEPANPDVLYAANQVYSLLANQAFLSLAQIAPDSARMYQLRGDRMKRAGNIAGAIVSYRQAIRLDSHLAGAHFALAECLNVSQSSSEHALAEAEYLRALAENAEDEKAECRLGAIAVDRVDLVGDTRHYKRALQIQPDDPEANEGMGVTLLAANSDREAIAYLKRALQLDPTDLAGHYRLSQASKRAGDLEEAKLEMQQYLKFKAQKEALEQSFKGLSLQPTAPAVEKQGNRITSR